MQRTRLDPRPRPDHFSLCSGRSRLPRNASAVRCVLFSDGSKSHRSGGATWHLCLDGERVNEGNMIGARRWVDDGHGLAASALAFELSAMLSSLRGFADEFLRAERMPQPLLDSSDASQGATTGDHADLQVAPCHEAVATYHITVMTDSCEAVEIAAEARNVVDAGRSELAPLASLLRLLVSRIRAFGHEVVFQQCVRTKKAMQRVDAIAKGKRPDLIDEASVKMYDFDIQEALIVEARTQFQREVFGVS